MLEEQDLQKIGQVVKKEIEIAEKRIVDSVVGQVGEMIEQNINPQLESIRNDIKTLPDKDFVTRLVGGVDGKSVARDKTLMEKTNAITDVLTRKNVLTSIEVSAIQRIQFARENQ